MARNKQQQQQQQSQHQQHHQHQRQQQHEFLPLCDVLFNIISLASYFCDIVFDVAMAYALAQHNQTPPILFPLSVGLVVTALIVSQIASLRWYLWGPRGRFTKTRIGDTSDNEDSRVAKNKSNMWTVRCIILLHCTQMGVLWRYFKLFVPVDLKYVKHEVRELCVLRLIHAFCEAAPMLLLQLYVLSMGIGNDNAITDDKTDKFTRTREADKLAELTAVSAGLSLWSVCWAVASFSKGAARLRNLERLVLTWLGVLAQLAWRLGTVSARVGALVAYASLYGGQWLVVVIALHWLSMLTWLILTPDGLFHGDEKLSFSRKAVLAGMLAFVYVFAYVNLHETNHRQKMVIFYTVMFLENSLLIGVWAVGSQANHFQSLRQQPRPIVLVLILLALFLGGLIFMGLYYRFFHVRRLRYEAGGRMNGTNPVVPAPSTKKKSEGKRVNCNNDEDADRRNANEDDDDDDEDADDDDDDDNDDDVDENFVGTRKKFGNAKKVVTNNSASKLKPMNSGIPGVFNCRFANPAVTNFKRKKKKPTTFVPPPPTQQQQQQQHQQQQQQQQQQQPAAISVMGEAKPWCSNGGVNTRQLIPFWKRPLSSGAAFNQTTTAVTSVVPTDTPESRNNCRDNGNADTNDDDDDDNNNANDNDDDGGGGGGVDVDEWSEKKNEIDVAVGSMNVNLIREKLREKKQQQLRELRAIQEEIKEGKLVPPPSASTSSFSSTLSATNQQPPPNTKLHTSPNLPLVNLPPTAKMASPTLTDNSSTAVALTCWPPARMHCLLPPPPPSSMPYNPQSQPCNNAWKGFPPRAFRPGTPEILLAPRCLPLHYTHWTPSGHRLGSNEIGEDDSSSKGECEAEVEISDIEGSQVSLPRSYTLPREFKYNNSMAPTRERGHVPASKLYAPRLYLPSTNSSDGDVDSADNEEETDSELQDRAVNGYGLGHDANSHGRCFPYVNGETMGMQNSEPNTNLTNSSMLVGSLGCHLSNSYAVLRPNQLQRPKVKHETKL